MKCLLICHRIKHLCCRCGLTLKINWTLTWILKHLDIISVWSVGLFLTIYKAPSGDLCCDRIEFLNNSSCVPYVFSHFRSHSLQCWPYCACGLAFPCPWSILATTLASANSRMITLYAPTRSLGRSQSSAGTWTSLSGKSLVYLAFLGAPMANGLLKRKLWFNLSSSFR